MATAVLSRWARRFLVVGVVALVASQVAAIAGLGGRTEVVLGLYGFVLTVAFGKAYSLVPSYFDRTLVEPRAPAVHLPLLVFGVACLAVAPLDEVPEWVDIAGATAWATGVAVFAVTIGATIAANPLGRETGTGEANADRAGLDRLANPFMPVAAAYLVVGTYELLAAAWGLPTVLGGSSVRITHLLGAGFALLLLFSVGYRLLPRFLVVPFPKIVAAPVLLSGAVGPALLAVGYPSGPVFQAGAILESVAVVGFAASYAWLFVRTDRDRVGFYGPLAGVFFGVVGVALGTWFAFRSFDAALIAAHRRVNVFGLLGLSILGVIYQFYPPAVSDWPGDGDRLALGSLALVAAGVALAAVVPIVSRFAPSVDQTVAAGFVLGSHLAVGLGGAVTEYLLVGAMASRRR